MIRAMLKFLASFWLVITIATLSVIIFGEFLFNIQKWFFEDWEHLDLVLAAWLIAGAMLWILRGKYPDTDEGGDDNS